MAARVSLYAAALAHVDADSAGQRVADRGRLVASVRFQARAGASANGARQSLLIVFSKVAGGGDGRRLGRMANRASMRSMGCGVASPLISVVRRESTEDATGFNVRQQERVRTYGKVGVKIK